MDDEEYYKTMRNQYSHKNAYSFSKKINKDFSFTKWTSHEGREDAQMLQDKKKEKLKDEENQ